MADASSSDTTSDCCIECSSDITSEKSEYVVVGRKPYPSHRRSKRNFLQKLLIREMRGCLSAHNYASEERLFITVPRWRHLPLLHVIPKSALEAGHVVMGLTQCGQFLLTYTYTVDLSSPAVQQYSNTYTTLYKYLLHWWAFTPNHVARKVAEVSLFGNYTIYRELSIVISQWPMERNKLVIHGLCSNSLNLQLTDRAYLTITTVPSLENCKDCLKIAASYEEDGEELAANWDGCIRCNCLQHGLTVHTTYEVTSPYPKFRATVCLNYWNHVVINTGNFLHILRVDLNIPKSKNQRTCDKQDTSAHDPMVPETIPLDMSDAEETDYSTRTERYESSDEKVDTSECVDRSPKCESSLEQDFLDEPIKLDDKLGRDLPLNTSSSNQSDCVCDIRDKSAAADPLTVKLCECSDECKCRNGSGGSPVARPSVIEQMAISVRDKILQDFCEDTSQELNIGSDLITLVKHPSCSPRSAPQRLPSDLRTMTTWSSQILIPPSDILRTRNSESSHRIQVQRSSSSTSISGSSQQRSSSPQPGASQQDTNSINSSLQSTVSISSSSSCSSHLMSPPLAKYFRLPSPRKRSNLHSPPPVVNATQSTRTTRATHKLIEAEKAYEFTDEVQETTCEKLSSFRKRRLADKKYEFCDEAEDAENIVPFRHIRDQFRHRGACSIHQIPSSPAMSPVLPNGRRHWVDSDQSESDELNLAQDISIANDLSNPETTEKNVLRPLNQNQLSNGSMHRDRVGKCCPNFSPLVPRNNLQYPLIKCTARFKRSYIELDDEMISVITDVEDEETGGYVGYQCVLPMLVHGSGYVQMQMINNSKAEKLIVPCVSITQLSFDIETFSHHVADWICARFKKKYWHCSDYDIEIIDVCALTGDIICLHIMKIQASELYSQTQCPQERKQYEVGCKFTWNIDTSQYRITDVLPMEEVKPDSWKQALINIPNFSTQLWNPTRRLATQLREKSQQPYAHTVRFLHNELSLAGETITKLTDLDNLVQFYMTPIPNDALIE
ncbi:uncharacterized protein [Linepithema humile]|uniref:uncharacterized protein isoform X2 n=1 Tax=Linepithema humile TaxID=83485 RepID=UPI000622FED1|nr:PREDICTED: uncharacterized protein LOC105674572 isoform X2 [Linepithema humile]